MKYCFLLPLLFAIFPSYARTGIGSKSVLRPATDMAKNMRNMKNMPGRALAFLENKGQIRDQFDNGREDILYKVATPGLNIYIGAGQLHYQFCKHGKENAPAAERLHHPIVLSVDTMYRMDVSLLNANKHAKVLAEEKQAYREQYFLPHCSNVTAYTYSKVTFKDIYPGIDWVIYSKDGKLEYDFVVHPGGNPGDIKIQYSGTTGLKTFPDNSIHAATPMGSIVEHAPYSYEAESRQYVSSVAVVHGNVLSFKTGSYKGTLVIDPALEWATYYGGALGDNVEDVVVDKANNIFVTGETSSIDDIATLGAYQTVLQGEVDAIVAKFSAAGMLEWSTYYGGNYIDEGFGITCDNADDLYIIGITSSVTGLATAGAYQTALSGLYDGMLAKFDSSGMLQWATYFGGSRDEILYDVACDSAGNAVIVGHTNSTSGIATSGSYQDTIGASGYFDAFIAKFSSIGALQWATYYGGTNDDEAFCVKCDANGNIFVAGRTRSLTNIATAGAYKTIIAPPYDDGLLSKFSSSGRLLWGTYFGGRLYDCIRGLALNNMGDVFITGSTNSFDLPTSGTYQPTHVDLGVVYLASFDTSGIFNWCTYYGDSSAHHNYGEADNAECDRAGNVYIFGNSDFTRNIISPSEYSPSLSSSNFVLFLGEFSRAGAFIQGKYYGYGGNADSYGLAIDTSSAIILSGNNSIYTGFTTPGSYQSTYGGGVYDGFVIKFSPDTSVYFPPPFTDTSLCAGSSFNIPYAVTRPFNAGNTFTAQLSNAAGGFGSPVAIGIASSVSAGAIHVNIPAGTPAGTGYKIRLIASTPADTTDKTGSIAINPVLMPAVSISSSPVIVVSGSSATFTAVPVNGGPAPVYQWYYNGVSVAGATSNAYTVPVISSGDLVQVTLYSSLSCSSPDSATSQVSLGISANNLEKSGLLIYPNPARDVVTLQWNNIDNGQVVITDVEGITLFKETLSSATGIKQIDLKNYPQGIYLYKLIKNNEVAATGLLLKE